MTYSTELYSSYLAVCDQVDEIVRLQLLIEVSGFLVSDSPFDKERFGSPAEQAGDLIFVYQNLMWAELKELEDRLRTLGTYLV